jgi:hypothetical protein
MTEATQEPIHRHLCLDGPSPNHPSSDGSMGQDYDYDGSLTNNHDHG